jgi:N-acetylglucosamine-6-phosphate deacetylase
VDGHHLPAATVKTMVRSKSPARTILITDATSAADCAPGRYELNGEIVVLSEDGRVSPPGKPWLAGSALRLDHAIVNAVRFTGLPLETVWKMASTQPANYLGLQPVGTIIADWDSATSELTNLKIIDS